MPEVTLDDRLTRIAEMGVLARRLVAALDQGAEAETDTAADEAITAARALARALLAVGVEP